MKQFSLFQLEPQEYKMFLTCNRLTLAEHGSKARDNALHAACCNETIKYVAFATTTSRVFLNRTPLPSAFDNFKETKMSLT